MARHREHPNGWLWVLPSLLIPVAIAAVAWTTHVASEGDEIAPNVRFAGVDLSGLAPSDAATEIQNREAEFLATPVVIDLGPRQMTLTAGEIGYDYLFTDTVSAAMSARHADEPWPEFVSWISTPFQTVEISDHYTFDTEKARERLSTDDFILSHPIEPVLTNDDSSYMYIVPGTDGTGVDIDQVIAALETADVTAGPVSISAEQRRIEPLLPNGEAERVALNVNELTRNGLLAVIADHTAKLTAGQVRRNLVSTVEDGEMSIAFDLDGLQQEIEAAFPEPIGDFEKPRLEVVDGKVVVRQEGEPPPICCSRESVERAAEQYLEGGSSFFFFETRADDDPTAVSWADGSAVTEVVAEFTTNHPCCESRVTNIQTMADFMRGFYLLPGETLSMNEYVGPRTREKGYVAAGAIRSGYMTDEVGGGVSQFVTTIFNAAFYAGLDLDRYQSHSIYFSRYPFGREATLSIPGPDLVLTNSTEFPVLIWPTYDDTSITVTMYSTKNVMVEELEQRITRRNQCRHSEIDRQRTFSDGRVEVDTIIANYRPGDGLDCAGRPIPQA
ncbi:MAG TPA: VanW family protein [Acidimicrobiia bacterium]|nr:VanW family protein [Acidimicrobiia bacterium]